MKLRDENGEIVIDTNETSADIEKLRTSKAELMNTKVKLVRLDQNMEQQWKGDAKNSFSLQIRSIIKQLDKAIESIDTSMKCIKTTVEHYKETDKRIANLAKGVN